MDQTRLLGLVCLMLFGCCRACLGEATAPRLITGVAVPTLLRAVCGDTVAVTQQAVQRRGVLFLLSKDGRTLGALEIGVFADGPTALTIFREHVRTTSAPPAIADHAEIGDHCARWETRVVFSRLNAVVSLALPRERLAQTARHIDHALQQGINGVAHGETVAVPHIDRITVPPQIIAGTVVPIAFQIRVRDHALSTQLQFVDRLGVSADEAPLAPVDAEFTITGQAQFHAPKIAEQASTVETWLCYASPQCVIAAKQLVLTITHE